MFGVEPICRVLKDHDFKSAPGAFYAHLSRPASVGSLSDARLLPIVTEVHRDNYGVYGVRKMWRAILRRGELIGRDQVVRLMRGAAAGVSLTRPGAARLVPRSARLGVGGGLRAP